jgi:hypothetical protein
VFVCVSDGCEVSDLFSVTHVILLVSGGLLQHVRLMSWLLSDAAEILAAVAHDVAESLAVALHVYAVAQHDHMP